MTLKQAETQKPFAWAPAAITFLSDGGLGVYIKYGKNPNTITVKEVGSDHVWVQCPDRDLVLVNNAHRGWGWRPANGTYDEYVHIGPYHDHLNADMNLPYFMVNYIAESQKTGNISLPRNEDIVYNPNSVIMCDSGGFQLRQGRVDYLDPLEIVKWYNGNVDLGFSLDVPTNVASIDFMRRSARIQARNNEIMLANKSDNLELINILHGANLETLKEYKSIVDTPDIDRVSIAGLYHFFSLMSSVDTLYQLTSEASWKHLHVLGVSNFLHVALMIRMRVKGLLPHLTSDSSTAMQKARLREYHTFTSPHERVKYTLVGFKDGYRPSPVNTLPCNCAVCSAVKYSDVLWVLNGNIAHKLFEFHNIYSLSRYFDLMTEICAESSTNDLKRILYAQLGDNRVGYDEALQTLDFIDSLANHGHATASSRYAIYLDGGLFSDMGDPLTEPNALFDEGRGSDETENDSDQSEVVQGDGFMEAILLKYEDRELQTKLKHGKKIKTEIANTRATKNTAGGANTKPQTLAQLKKGRTKASKEVETNDS